VAVCRPCLVITITPPESPNSYDVRALRNLLPAAPRVARQVRVHRRV